MSRRQKYVLIALALQLVQVIAGRLFDPILELAGLFGMGIPLVVGWLYAVRRGLSLGDVSLGGVLIGAVGAFAGLVLAAALGSVEWSFLLLGTAASTGTGLIGALLGWVLKGRKEPLRSGS